MDDERMAIRDLECGCVISLVTSSQVIENEDEEILSVYTEIETIEECKDHKWVQE